MCLGLQREAEAGLEVQKAHWKERKELGNGKGDVFLALIYEEILGFVFVTEVCSECHPRGPFP